MSDPITFPWQAPLFPPPPHSWSGVQVTIFPFAPDPQTLARILPPAFEPRDGLGMITMLEYPPADNVAMHPFNEAVVLVPVTCKGVEANYVPYIYVTTDEALVPGREIAGWPKKIGAVRFERGGGRFRGTVTRWGTTLLTLEGDVGDPVPADAAAAAAPPPPTLNYKVIPGPAGEIEVEEVTLSRLEIVTRSTSIGSGRLSTSSSEYDPLGELVPDSEGMMISIVSDNTIPAAEVLERIDTRIDTRAGKRTEGSVAV